MSLELAHRVIPDAQIQAFQHPQVAPPPRGFRGGIVLGDTEEDRRLRHTRYRKPVDSFIPDADYPITLSGSYVYAGPTYHHFGHVLAEMVHRIVPAKRLSRDPHWILVTTLKFPRSTFDRLYDWLKPIYAFLEMEPGNVTILNENTTVSELLVVEQGSDLGGGPKPGYLAELADFTHGRLDRLHGKHRSYGKVYVSRSSHGTPGSVLGERYIEQALAAEGYLIFHPERHTFTEQMDIYRKAEILVFPEGSACHGVELLGEAALGNVVFVNRRHSHLDTFKNVLAPRAAKFQVFGRNVPLGSVAADPYTGTPLEHLGVSLFDLDALVDFCRTNGIANLKGITQTEYRLAAEGDLLRYLENEAASQALFTNLDHLKSLLAAFSKHRLAT